jgi:N-acyl homoserine lactone hydrolase
VTLSKDDIRRVPLGHYTRPAGDPLAGRRIVVGAYLVPHPDGLLLFDSGFGEGEDPELDRYYRTVRRPLRDGLRGAGVELGDVGLVVNCHLHRDHCGGNRELPGRPLFVQRAELEAARGPGDTVPALVDFPGAAYEVLDGEAELLPGVRVVPTPGHTAGHQSLVVDCAEAPLDDDPAWVGRLQALDPCRVLLAHDLASVEAGDGAGQGVWSSPTKARRPAW